MAVVVVVVVFDVFSEIYKEKGLARAFSRSLSLPVCVRVARLALSHRPPPPAAAANRATA
jgi:hypothetical protein